MIHEQDGSPCSRLLSCGRAGQPGCARECVSTCRNNTSSVSSLTEGGNPTVQMLQRQTGESPGRGAGRICPKTKDQPTTHAQPGGQQKDWRHRMNSTHSLLLPDSGQVVMTVTQPNVLSGYGFLGLFFGSLCVLVFFFSWCMCVCVFS